MKIVLTEGCMYSGQIDIDGEELDIRDNDYLAGIIKKCLESTGGRLAEVLSDLPVYVWDEAKEEYVEKFASTIDEYIKMLTEYESDFHYVLCEILQFLGKYEMLYHCDECGDTVSEYVLEV